MPPAAAVRLRGRLNVRQELASRGFVNVPGAVRAADRRAREPTSQGQLLDNALTESFFATLKRSSCGTMSRNRERRRARDFEYIEIFYNRQSRSLAAQLRDADDLRGLP